MQEEITEEDEEAAIEKVDKKKMEEKLNQYKKKFGGDFSPPVIKILQPGAE